MQIDGAGSTSGLLMAIVCSTIQITLHAILLGRIHTRESGFGIGWSRQNITLDFVNGVFSSYLTRTVFWPV
ncbi:hypothetical protein [Planctopirus hydrillae]|uniref:hypothetical protein n=1 Tax=Planctopirus hydrillae TaxID=1841610 RepID=UPI001041DD1C|nr:hypothetical protein [Planctopirus hydrillae]